MQEPSGTYNCSIIRISQVCNYHHKSMFLSFSKTRDYGYFLVPFSEAFCSRLRFWGPPGSFMGSLWGAWVAPLSSLRAAFCVLVCAWISFGVPLGSSGGRKNVSARFLVDVWGCFPAIPDFQRHPHPSPRPKKSGIQDSKNLRFKYAVGPRFEASVKHIFEDSWHG